MHGGEYVTRRGRPVFSTERSWAISHTREVDTSALFALMDADDEHHARAMEAMRWMADQDRALVTSSYVLVETFALLQGRLGVRAVRAFVRDVLPVLDVEWVDESTHLAAVAALLSAGRRRLSLVDCVSFETMRRLGLRTAFTFDAHFDEQGFSRVPGRGVP